MTATLFVGGPTFYQSGAGNIIGATSITLTSFQDIYGNVLTMADFGTIGYITCEPDTTNQEFLTFTGVTANANGTYTLTGIKTSLAKYPYTETSGAIRNHAGGTKVVISDGVAFWNTFLNKNNASTIGATYTFTVTPVLSNAPVSSTDAANKGYVDGVAIAGAPKAATTVFGIVHMSVDPASAATPIAVGDNDGRVPTQAENDALAGTSGTPSSSNKFVTNADTGATAVIGAVARRNSTGDVTVNTTPTATTDAASKAYVDSVTTKLTTSPAVVTVGTSSTAEATLKTYTLAGGVLGTTNAVRITGYLIIADGGAGGANYTIRLKYGGTTLCTIVNAVASSAIYNLKLDATIIADGATNAQSADMTQIGTTGTSATRGTATEDSTGALAIAITGQNSQNNAISYIKIYNLVISKVI